MNSVIVEMIELLGEASVDLNQLVKLPRFEFIAEYLVIQTAKKENRDRVQGYQVKKVKGKYRVISTGVKNDDPKYGPVDPSGTVVFETDDAHKLFDYARRGPLMYFIREADHLRLDAHPSSG